MESLGDDLLDLIVSKIDNPDDRKSFSEVCKQWLRVEGRERSTLRVLEPELLPNFLPRFPNLLKFRASIAIPNSLIQFLPNTCPRLQFLDLNYDDQEEDLLVEYKGNNDIDDKGLWEIAKGCPDLETVLLRGRSAIGDLGVVSLAEFARNLRNLDLGFCRKISDEALKSIAGLNNLEMLSLQGCYLITDIGLSFLAEGPVHNTLIELNLAGCNRITDLELTNLREMDALEELNLAECGPNVTGLGIEIGVAGNWRLKKLNLSWLVNVTDSTLEALAERCWSLEVLDLTGCISISVLGISAFSSHRCLKELVLIHCDIGVYGVYLEDLVLGCSSLERIVLSKNVWIPTSVRENIVRQNCVLDWE
ncbi:hypothetical protein CDL12_16873 [Handroanthus impetiginosus]|uniref:Uncharacterized protein n=1 Tax=Handroanthus impetiginosus TaxID=429701 RepID=A0A2G9GZ35_9LAMI|nr:hypothetical protein CDL12_16873 [Handroanthus impetiginosus]